MLDFITRQTQWYTDAAAKLNWTHFKVSRFVLPIGINGKTGKLIRMYEADMGYVDYDNLVTRGTFRIPKIEVIK